MTGTSFTDAAGREWPIRITLGTLPRLKALGVVLSFDPDGVAAATAAAFRDADTAGRVLWLFAETPAGDRGVTPEQLAEAMDGPAIAAAVDAFTAAVVDFTHRPTVAPAVKAKLAATRAEMEALVASALTSSGSAGGPPATGAAATPVTSATANSAG